MLKSRIGDTNINFQGVPMKIVGYRNSRDIDVEFPNNCIVYHKEYRKFLSGHLSYPYYPSYLGIGYLGDGKYKSRNNSIKTDAYIKWGSMLTRCYSDKYIKSEAYENCFVDPCWHNFQNFAKWYYENIYELADETIELDKEIKYKSCRIYSADTCLLVPHKLNTIFCNRAKDRGKYLIGITHYDSSFYYVSCNTFGKRCQVGKYKTEYEAFLAYKEYKENEISRLAESYRGKIPDAIIEYAKNYEVKQYD